LAQLNSASNVLAGKIISITNGLATTAYVNTATNGLVTSAVTNGLATVSYVNFGTNFAGTNGLAQLNSASNALAGKIISITNGLATVGYVNFGTNLGGTNGLAQLNSASNVLAGKIISATNILAAPALVGTVPVASLGNALTNFNAAPVVLNGKMTNNSAVFTPTNTAGFSFPILTIKADGVLHTNSGQRAQLVGSAVLANSLSADANITAVISQGAVTNVFPMAVSKALGVLTNTMPFNFPLNPNAVWYFTNLSAGSVSYITNAVVIGE
jgi:hypothetical protein